MVPEPPRTSQARLQFIRSFLPVPLRCRIPRHGSWSRSNGTSTVTGPLATWEACRSYWETRPAKLRFKVSRGQLIYEFTQGLTERATCCEDRLQRRGPSPSPGLLDLLPHQDRRTRTISKSSCWCQQCDVFLARLVRPTRTHTDRLVRHIEWPPGACTPAGASVQVTTEAPDSTTPVRGRHPVDSAGSHHQSIAPSSSPRRFENCLGLWLIVGAGHNPALRVRRLAGFLSYSTAMYNNTPVTPCGAALPDWQYRRGGATRTSVCFWDASHLQHSILTYSSIPVRPGGGSVTACLGHAYEVMSLFGLLVDNRW